MSLLNCGATTGDARAHVSAHKGLMQILELLEQVDSLRPRFDNDMSNNGTPQRVVTLVGTIPINCNCHSTTSDLPVSLRLPPSFPNQSPICKVGNMHCHLLELLCVDERRRMRHPYLLEWNQHQSTLVELVNMIMLCCVDCKDPQLQASKKKVKHMSPVALDEDGIPSLAQ